jgi:hypothetical protein
LLTFASIDLFSSQSPSPLVWEKKETHTLLNKTDAIPRRSDEPSVQCHVMNDRRRCRGPARRNIIKIRLRLPLGGLNAVDLAQPPGTTNKCASWHES